MYAHLRSRWFDPTKYSGVFVTPEVTTFLLWTLSGQCAGYQTYCPSAPKLHKNKDVNPLAAKYYTHTTPGLLSVWGLETLDHSRPLLLTEGVFDAARLHWAGVPAVAVLGNNPEHLRGWLKCLHLHTVAACQGDAAGKKLAKYAKKVVYLPENEDVNSLSEEQFVKFFGKWF